MRVLEAGEDVFLLRFLPDGRRLLVGTARSGSRSFVGFAVWSLAGGNPVRLRVPEADARGFAVPGNTVAIHPDGATCYLVWNRRLFAFRTATGRAVSVPPGVKGHRMIMSPAGDRLVAVDWGTGGSTTPIYLYAVTVGPRGRTVVRR